jgi:ADP-ribosylglycohydrolase
VPAGHFCLKPEDRTLKPETAKEDGMREKADAMVMAAFIGDSLALGAHWIYDVERIHKAFGTVDSLLKPGLDSYHATKDRGDFTHYGDQMLVLLRSVAAMKGFDLQDFSSRWQTLFKNYDGYMDKATKVTLEGYGAGKGPEAAGSSSTDLAGAVRIAPVVYVYRDRIDSLTEAARAQTRMTHRDPQVIESAVFFSKVGSMVLAGASPLEAMKTVAKEDFGLSPIRDWVEAGVRSTGRESTPAIREFGQSCHVAQAFPGVVHLIAKYENDLKEGLVQAVMAGGDNAARAMAVGMVLGARLGWNAIPSDWLSALKKKDEIRNLLDAIP